MRHKVCTVEYICNGMESAYLSTDTFGVQICICTERVCTSRPVLHSQWAVKLQYGDRGGGGGMRRLKKRIHVF